MVYMAEVKLMVAIDECNIPSEIKEYCREVRRLCYEDDDEDACAAWKFDCRQVRVCIMLKVSTSNL